MWVLKLKQVFFLAQSHITTWSPLLVHMWLNMSILCKNPIVQEEQESVSQTKMTSKTSASRAETRSGKAPPGLDLRLAGLRRSQSPAGQTSLFT